MPGLTAADFARMPHERHFETKGVRELKGFTETLTPEALGQYTSDLVNSTVMDVCGACGEPVPWGGPEDDDPGPCTHATREIRLVRYIAKPVPLDDEGEVAERYVVALAAAYNRLVEGSKVILGVLGPAMLLELVPRDATGTLMVDEGATYVEPFARQGLLLLYPLIAGDYKVNDNAALNAYLGEEWFAEEGAMASEDWTNMLH